MDIENKNLSKSKKSKGFFKKSKKTKKKKNHKILRFFTAPFRAIGRKIGNTKLFKPKIAEFKLIKWCKFKEWMKYSFIVIVIAAIMAIMLTGFDALSQLITQFIGGFFG